MHFFSYTTDFKSRRHSLRFFARKNSHLTRRRSMNGSLQELDAGSQFFDPVRLRSINKIKMRS